MTTSRTKFPPDPETWMQITPTCQEIYDRSIPFPPVAPGYNIFPTCMIDKSDPCLQIQHEWDPTRITNLMSALPHFDIPARTDDPSPPPIHSYMAGFCQTGRDLYNFLFSGTPPTLPAETTLDDPMGADPPPASTDGGPNKSGLSKEHEVTIFSKMVDDCIDIPKSFDDPHRLSAPEIQGSENQLQGRPRIAKPRMMKENGAKKRTAHTGSFRQQTQRTRGDAKKTMLRNCLGYFKESMQS